MIYGFNMSSWDDARNIRLRFSEAGFHLADRLAEHVSALSHGAFSREESIETAARQTQTFVAQPRPMESSERNAAVREMVVGVQKRAGDNFAALVRSPLIRAKVAEIDGSRIGEAEVLKRTAIRRFAEEVGKQMGFVMTKSLEDEFTKRPMVRRPGKISGYFWVDTGGSSTPYVSDTGLQFTLFGVNETSFHTDVLLNDFLPGADYYDRLNGSLEDRFGCLVDGVRLGIQPHTPDLVSKTAKWGVLAQLTLFSLILESLDAAAVPTG